MTIPSQTAAAKVKLDYADLVGLLDCLEPNGGWQNAAQLPTLTDAQLAVCLHANPDAHDDTVEALYPLREAVCDSLTDPGVYKAEAVIGTTYRTLLTKELRRLLLRDLQDLQEAHELSRDGRLDTDLVLASGEVERV